MSIYLYKLIFIVISDCRLSLSAFDSLSAGAKTIWAKASHDGSECWLPLVMHMYDSAEVARLLWHSWIPLSTKNLIAEHLNASERNAALEFGERLFIFLAAAHDLGKATPAFQNSPSLIEKNRSLAQELRCAIEKEGLLFNDNLQDPRCIPHSLVSQQILFRNQFKLSVAVTLGGHHGKPPSRVDIQVFDSYPNHTGFEGNRNKSWVDIQNELLEYAASLSGSDMNELRLVELPVTVQAILTGLIIMVDWIASDERKFPYIDSPYCTKNDFTDRASVAWEELDLPWRWQTKDYREVNNLFCERFGSKCQARPVQRVAEQVSRNLETPGIIIIEAPMGEGKTEAALVAAEILADKFGFGGLFFALPTQATADGIFPRVRKWIGKATKEDNANRTIFLAHGKSAFNTEYRHVRKTWNSPGHLSNEDPENKENVIIHEWFSGRKRGLLSDFVIGTVDQILMGGLKQKHLALRHVALANKVIIIDEVHAYDAYMGSYLSKILRWLGAYKVPVILLSATLPQDRRKELVTSYLGSNSKLKEDKESSWASNRSYPLLTYTDGETVKQATSETSGRDLVVKVDCIPNEKLFGVLGELTEDGGYVGIIVNTVRKAQEVTESLREKYGKENVYLLHSRFVSIDRTLKEKAVREMLSKENRKMPPHRVFVVGTQVMEQSLDLDFDLMVTDICPMDLLLQRIGRLHRHDNIRANRLKDAQCFVLDSGSGEFDEGSKAVYKEYSLMNTRYLLSKTKSLSLPMDIPALIQSAYSADGIDMPSELQDKYQRAKEERDDILRKKEDRAKVFQIADPRPGRMGLVGWLDRDSGDDKTCEATVRDIDGSVEVIVIQQRENKFFLLPLDDRFGGVQIPIFDTPEPDMCFTLAGCKITLPQFFSGWRLDKTIKELERENANCLPKCWQESEWLAGELFLVLNGDGVVYLSGKKMIYDNILGLRVMEGAE